MTDQPYPWDEWERHALKDGIDPELATLCRATLREAYGHAWKGHAYALCVHSLTELASRAPELTRKLCEVLLETDGLDFARDEQTDEIFELPNSLRELAGEAYL